MIRVLEKRYGVKIVWSGDTYKVYRGNALLTEEKSLLMVEITLKEYFA